MLQKSKIKQETTPTDDLITGITREVPVTYSAGDPTITLLPADKYETHIPGRLVVQLASGIDLDPGAAGTTISEFFK